MARLHYVKRARKAIPEAEIEVGDSYYFFKKRVNGKGVPRVCSKTKPKRSAYTTSSPFLGILLDMEDEANQLVANLAEVEYVGSWLDATADAVEALGEDCLAKSQNVGEGMKNGSGQVSADMLWARAEHCSELARALREAANELETREKDEHYAALEAEGIEEDSGDDDCGQEGNTFLLGAALANIVWLP